jgi:hypothetical protein
MASDPLLGRLEVAGRESERGTHGRTVVFRDTQEDVSAVEVL